ncbi:MAG TPA: Uma2 family endonuclease [Gemmatales bacterium]|nr:Uma2 family endonuclease [Gemmatales bacterium]
MAVLISVDNGDLVFPSSVTDLPSFQSWFRSKDFPTIGKVIYYDGNVWIDPSSQQVLHCHVNSSLAAAIGGWTKHQPIGMTLCDGLRFTNQDADLSTEPDVLFFTEAGLISGKVKLMDGDASLEIEGSPEIIVEVISPTSAKKDEKTLREKYYEAGVQEYWLNSSTPVSERR